MGIYEELICERDPKSDAAWKARNSWWRTPCAEVKPEAIIPEIRRRWMQQGKIDALLAEGALIEARLVASEKIVAERKAVRRAHLVLATLSQTAGDAFQLSPHGAHAPKLIV